MTGHGDWSATLEVLRPTAADADRLFRALGPESSREVPRATASVERAGASGVRLRIAARDTGALRAALNTYLGWVQLALATEQHVAEA